MEKEAEYMEPAVIFWEKNFGDIFMSRDAIYGVLHISQCRNFSKLISSHEMKMTANLFFFRMVILKLTHFILTKTAENAHAKRS